MSTLATSSTAKVATDTKLARLFGLQGEAWLRHANPISVRTRFAGVFGERSWADRTRVDLLDQFRSSQCRR